MKVIILAAGKGTRLMPLTKDKPKCLIEIAPGRTLLETQLNALQHIEPSEVVVITGYRSAQIEEQVRLWQEQERYPMKITIVFNPFFDLSNNLASLYLARDFFTEDVIVVDGDDIYHRSVVEILSQVEEDGIWVCGSKKEKFEWEEMKLKIADERVVEISKEIPLEEANAESVGMVLFKGSHVALFKQVLHDIMHVPEALQWFWQAAIQESINRGYNVRPHYVPLEMWAEMDFHVDLELIQSKLEDYLRQSRVLQDDS